MSRFAMSSGFLVLALFSAQALASRSHQSVSAVLGGLSADNCVSSLSGLTAELDAMDAQDYLSELQNRPELQSELWSDKLALHAKLRAFADAGNLNRACANAFRGALRAIRTIEDYAEENEFRHRAAGAVVPDTAFAPGNTHVRKNPKFGADFDMQNDLKTGDIILSRGGAYTSAAISQLGEFDTQFSHMSVVYVDPQKKVWTVEAHIEVGSFVRPLKDHIADKNKRTMLFRFRDPVVAERAGRMIFEKVRDYSRAHGNIHYDFGFDPISHKSLFCSETVSYAYELGSDGKVLLPMFDSRLDQRKPSFVKMLGITVDRSFIPADIEIDPRFEVVSEWRDGNALLDMLQKDYLLQSVYDWNDRLGYQLIQGSSRTSVLYRDLVWPLRRVPLLKIPFKDKLPIYMSRDLIGYFGVIDTLGKLLQGKLNEADRARIQERDLPLLPSEARDVLETYRQEDLSARKPKLHRMFRPKSGKA